MRKPFILKRNEIGVCCRWEDLKSLQIKRCKCKNQTNRWKIQSRFHIKVIKQLPAPCFTLCFSFFMGLQILCIFQWFWMIICCERRQGDGEEAANQDKEGTTKEANEDERSEDKEGKEEGKKMSSSERKETLKAAAEPPPPEKLTNSSKTCVSPASNFKTTKYSVSLALDLKLIQL